MVESLLLSLNLLGTHQIKNHERLGGMRTPRGHNMVQIDEQARPQWMFLGLQSIVIGIINQLS